VWLNLSDWFKKRCLDRVVERERSDQVRMFEQVLERVIEEKMFERVVELERLD
jgi:hypothetical protein